MYQVLQKKCIEELEIFFERVTKKKTTKQTNKKTQERTKMEMNALGSIWKERTSWRFRGKKLFNMMCPSTEMAVEKLYRGNCTVL